MITIYHNPRCKKSREGLQYLESKTSEFNTRLYLRDGIKKDELEDLLKKLEIEPENLVRKQEVYYKQELKYQTLGYEEWVNEMVNNPKLIKRPIVVAGDKAVIAEPPENMDEII